jgi:CubicO group peptidase (beta-lactamase class C family)
VHSNEFVLVGVIAVSIATICVWKFLSAIAPSGTGYVAKTLCSAVFVSSRDPVSVQKEEFTGLNPLINLVKFRVDKDCGEVRASLFGLGAQRSLFRSGLGCTLVDFKSTLPTPPKALSAPRRPNDDDPLNLGVIQVPKEVDATRLKEAVYRAFDETGRGVPLRTRALLVMKDGRLIVERYGAGISAQTPLCGQSISKTITGALAGILVGRGLLDLNAPAPVKDWAEPDDPRSRILVKHLLTMTSGLSWTEDAYNPFSDLVRMLFGSRDMATYAARNNLQHTPGTRFLYNTGDTIILSRVLLAAMHHDGEAYLSLPRTALFDPAGMQSAIFEPDAAGTLVGSSFLYATARDFARFGELYLNDGARNGVQVLPKGWVTYSATPAPAAPQGCYGVQVWLNKGSPDSATLPRPSLPSDVMLMNGTFGQFVAVLPSTNMVIVRLGESHDWDLAKDPDSLITDLLKTFRKA